MKPEKIPLFYHYTKIPLYRRLNCQKVTPSIFPLLFIILTVLLLKETQ